MAVSKLLGILEGGGCKVVAYADDVAIIFKGKYPQLMRSYDDRERAWGKPLEHGTCSIYK